MPHPHCTPADFDQRVRDLAVLCRCGHDRGEHLVDAPHACEAIDACPPIAHGSEAHRLNPCTCRKFRPAHTRKAEHQADMLRIGAHR